LVVADFTAAVAVAEDSMVAAAVFTVAGKDSSTA
jgi:hypothetical protein